LGITQYVLIQQANTKETLKSSRIALLQKGSKADEVEVLKTNGTVLKLNPCPQPAVLYSEAVVKLEEVRAP